VSSDLRGAADLFDPARLTLAREASGLTQTELAKRVGVTPGAISQFERGYTRPTMATVRELSLALGFPPAFLMAGDPLYPVQPSQAFFRKLTSTSRREQSEACAAATLLQLFVQALERYVDLPAIDLPAVPVSAETKSEDIDQAAAFVRHSWGLGDGPIADVVREIEAHGIPVARVADIAAKVDGFSCLTFERPVVLLGQHKGDRARSRFDAAHELGHLVMHHEFRGGLKERERQAHRFASAFLAPPKMIKSLLPATVDFNSLLALKHAWGMSMQAFLMASRELGVMPEHTYRRAITQMSARGWRRAEPGYLGEPEQPRLIRQAVEMLETVGIEFDQIIEAGRLPSERIRRMIFEDRPKVVLEAGASG
jgi:Zn-dependent peptidase ImmA (M78 family)/transcriptional regulator with XRE-family HTH domain